MTLALAITYFRTAVLIATVVVLLLGALVFLWQGIVAMQQAFWQRRFPL